MDRDPQGAGRRPSSTTSATPTAPRSGRSTPSCSRPRSGPWCSTVSSTPSSTGCRAPPSRPTGSSRRCRPVPGGLRVRQLAACSAPTRRGPRRVHRLGGGQTDPGAPGRPAGRPRAWSQLAIGRGAVLRGLVAGAGAGARRRADRRRQRAGRRSPTSYLQRKPDGSYPNGFEIYFAVSCLDSAWPHDPGAVFARGEGDGAEGPAGSAKGWSTTTCAARSGRRRRSRCRR